MPSHRTVSTASLAVALVALGSLLTACSSDSSGADPVARKGASAHAQPTGTGSGTPVSGRTTATYTLDSAAGGGALDETVRRLKARAAAFGLAGAVIEAHGTTITAQAPGDAGDKLRQIAATAELVFRPVLADGAAATPDVRKEYAALDCSAKAKSTPPAATPDRPTAACDRHSGQKYLLGPAAIEGTDVKRATSQSTQGQWAVDLAFTTRGSAKFAAITATLSQNQAPTNEFAIVLDGNVLSAPMVQESITGGEAQITGTFTRQSAADLAALITSGALPVRLTVGSVTVQR